MMNEKNQTIAYYDDPTNAYANQTVHADMSAIYARFEKYLAPGAAVLDAGCGSGRDSLHFMKAGYSVTAIDASQEMCDFASQLLRQQAEVFHRLMRALVPGGVLYASWKYGDTERTETSSGRLFCDMTEQRAEALAQAEGGASIEACWISEDVRADRRSQKWLNVIFRKG